nr:putative signal peptide [Rodent pegivirus]
MAVYNSLVVRATVAAPVALWCLWSGIGFVCG